MRQLNVNGSYEVNKAKLRWRTLTTLWDNVLLMFERFRENYQITSPIYLTAARYEDGLVI